MSTRSAYDTTLWDLEDGENLSARFQDIRHRLLPEVKVETSVLRHLRTLLMSCVSDNEYIANLNVREIHPTHRDAPHILSIDTLMLPDSGQRPTGNQIIVPLVSCLPGDRTPRRPMSAVRRNHRKTNATSIFSMYDLSASSNLSGREMVITLTVNLPVFQYTLHELEPSSPEAPRLAEVSLTIVLSGGEPLIAGQNFGLLLQQSHGRPQSQLTVEPIHLHDTSRGEDVVGVWVLGGAHYEQIALAAFAAETEARRNMRLERRKGRSRARDEWTCRPVIVVNFSLIGESPRFSSGFLRMRVGSRESFDARLSYSHMGLTSPRSISAKFESRQAGALRERNHTGDASAGGNDGGSEGVRFDFGAMGARRETIESAGTGFGIAEQRSGRDGTGMEVRGGSRYSIGALEGRSARESLSGVGFMREIGEFGKMGGVSESGDQSARLDVEDRVPRIRVSEVLQYDADKDVERLSGLGEWTPEAEMNMLNEYCEKYLHVSYEEEMRREMEKIRQEIGR